MSKKKRELIKSSGPIFETHCHLDYLKEDSKEVIKKSAEYGVDKIITISVESKNIDETLKIANKFDNVYCTQGIHPHHAIEWDDSLATRIINNCSNENVVAIGEIGLDYFYDHSPKDVQRKVFEEQLQLAVDKQLPVIVHTRDAEEDTMAILNNFKLSHSAIVHCYTSNLELAEYSIKRNFLLGFNGIITFKNATNVRDALNITPIENIVLETDAPFLAPIPFRGKENYPYYLPFISKEVATIKDVDEIELLKTIYNNSSEFFLNSSKNSV